MWALAPGLGHPQDALVGAELEALPVELAIDLAVTHVFVGHAGVGPVVGRGLVVLDTTAVVGALEHLNGVSTVWRQGVDHAIAPGTSLVAVGVENEAHVATGDPGDEEPTVIHELEILETIEQVQRVGHLGHDLRTVEPPPLLDVDDDLFHEHGTSIDQVGSVERQVDQTSLAANHDLQRMEVLLELRHVVELTAGSPVDERHHLTTISDGDGAFGLDGDRDILDGHLGPRVRLDNLDDPETGLGLAGEQRHAQEHENEQLRTHSVPQCGLRLTPLWLPMN